MRHLPYDKLVRVGREKFMITETIKASRGNNGAIPDPEVPAKATRRRFTAEYKRHILNEAASSSDLGALLRREGLYSSNLTTWRKQMDRGVLTALSSKKRGRKESNNPLQAENENLRKENKRLERRLKRAELIIDIQKKAAQILGIPLSTPEEGEND
jgi:transposase